MKVFCLNDYIHPNVRNFEFANVICPLAVKQLSRARFEISNNNRCSFRIIVEGEEVEVFLKSKVTMEDFNHILYGIPAEEPSLIYFRDYINKYIAINSSNEIIDIITLLSEYQKSQYKSGSEFNDQLWFKIYNNTPFDNGMRRLYGAVWIDYEKQLADGDIIYDERHTNGIWAMPYSMFKKCFNDECRENYGDKFFVLKPLLDCKYIFDKKELIGDKFRVVAQCTLENAKSCLPIIEQYNELLHTVSTQTNEIKSDFEALKMETKRLSKDKTILEKKANKWMLFNRILLMIILFLALYIVFRGV